MVVRSLVEVEFFSIVACFVEEMFSGRPCWWAE